MKKYFSLILLAALMNLNQYACAQNNRYARVDSLLAIPKGEEALKVLDSLENLDENVYQYYKAKIYLSLQRYAESLQICNEQISKTGLKDTLLPKLYFISSLNHEYVGNLGQAVIQLEEAIKLDPDNVFYYLNASFYYGELADYKSCLSALEKAMKLDPKNASVFNNLSYYSSMNQQYEKAITYANTGMKVAKDKKTTAFLLNNRGFAQLGLKNYEAAKQDINDALKLDPENAYAYYNKALLYKSLGDNNLICENLQLAVFYGYIYSLQEMTDLYCK